VLERCREHRFKILLAWLLLLLVGAPTVPLLGVGARVATALSSITFVGMLLVVVLAVSQRRRTMTIAMIFVGPAAVIQLTRILLDAEAVDLATQALSMIALGYVVFTLVKHLFTSRTITGDTIAASICAYLFLAVLWAMAYTILSIADPDAFRFAADAVDTPMRFGSEDSNVVIYFSFVTMSTLGYGDIVPATPAARALSASQAIVGQVYLAVLVARLVGMHISQTRSD
jgi:hypothetical protein